MMKSENFQGHPVPEQSEMIAGLDREARSAVRRNVEQDCIVLYSGGVDSSVIAQLVDDAVGNGRYFLCGAGLSGSVDDRSRTALPPQTHFFTILNERIPIAASEVLDITEPASLSMFEDCVAFYLILAELNSSKNLSSSSVLTANGPDELFCGYDRFRRIVKTGGYPAVELEILKALKTAYALSAQVDKIAGHFGFVMKQPFLDQLFVQFGTTKVPVETKLLPDGDFIRKRIWRDYALSLGLSREIAFKPKKAMQYSMGIHKSVVSFVRQGVIKMPTTFDGNRRDSGRS